MSEALISVKFTKCFTALSSCINKPGSKTNVFMKNKYKANSSKGFVNNIEAWQSAVLVYCYFSFLNDVCGWKYFALSFYGIESCGLDFSTLFEVKILFLSSAGTTSFHFTVSFFYSVRG